MKEEEERKGHPIRLIIFFLCTKLGLVKVQQFRRIKREKFKIQSQKNQSEAGYIGKRYKNKNLVYLFFFFEKRKKPCVPRYYKPLKLNRDTI